MENNDLWRFLKAKPQWLAVLRECLRLAEADRVASPHSRLAGSFDGGTVRRNVPRVAGARSMRFLVSIGLLAPVASPGTFRRHVRYFVVDEPEVRNVVDALSPQAP